MGMQTIIFVGYIDQQSINQQSIHQSINQSAFIGVDFFLGQVCLVSLFDDENLLIGDGQSVEEGIEDHRNPLEGEMTAVRFLQADQMRHHRRQNASDPLLAFQFSSAREDSSVFVQNHEADGIRNLFQSEARRTHLRRRLLLLVLR